MSIAVAGGEGNDKIYIGNPDEYSKKGEPVEVIGGSGDDTIIINGFRSTKMYGGKGNDTIWGGSKDDQIFGNEGNDDLLGRDGDDWVFGGTGADSISTALGKNYIDPGDDDDVDLLDLKYGDHVFLVHMHWKLVNFAYKYTTVSDSYYNFVHSDQEYPIYVYHGGPKDTSNTGHYEPDRGPAPGTSKKSYPTSVTAIEAVDPGDSWEIPKQELYITQELSFAEALSEFPLGFDPYTAFYETSLLTSEARLAVQSKVFPSDMVFDPSAGFQDNPGDVWIQDDNFVAAYLEPEAWMEDFLSIYFHDLLVFYGTLEDIGVIPTGEADLSPWVEMMASDAFSLLNQGTDNSFGVAADSGTMLFQPDAWESPAEPLLEINSWLQPYSWFPRF